MSDIYDENMKSRRRPKMLLQDEEIVFEIYLENNVIKDRLYDYILEVNKDPDVHDINVRIYFDLWYLFSSEYRRETGDYYYDLLKDKYGDGFHDKHIGTAMKYAFINVYKTTPSDVVKNWKK